MTTALAMPHFVNYPGTLPGQILGSLPPVPASQYPPSTPNDSNYRTVSLPTLQVPIVPVGGGCYNE